MAKITTQEEQWHREFSAYYFDHTKRMPLFIAGDTPTIDIRTIQSLPSIEEAWFYYPLDQYNLDYWELLELGDWHSVVCQLSTAQQLSERIGIPTVDRNIPSLWILHIERM